MQTKFPQSRWTTNKKALVYGLAAGVLWGFLTTSTAIPPEWLIYDEAAGVVYKYLDGERVSAAIKANYFFADLTATLVQVTLVFLVLVGLSGWSTWQLTRIRPRGEEQPRLRDGWDWYLLGLVMGGLAFVVLFRVLGLDIWLKGSPFSPVRLLSIGLSILLPLYMGVSLFLVWFFRLKSIRAPDWDAHHRKSSKNSSSFFRWLWQEFSRKVKG